MKKLATFEGVWALGIYAVGQFVSLIGSSLTGFALGVWLYLETGSVTPLALNAICMTLPGLLAAPVIGSLVDRWDRRLIIILSDTTAGVATLALFLLLSQDQLAVWHIYVATAVTSLANAFQQPAFAASIPLLVPKEHLGRANGLILGGNALAQIIAPVVAGFLLVAAGLQTIMIIDFLTYLVALIALVIVRFPRPKPGAEQAEGKGSVWQEAAYGWRYITERPGLRGLLIFFAGTNFISGLITVLVIPLILVTASPSILGTILTVGGFGMLVGALAMGIWGGPKQRIVGILGGVLVIGLCIMVIGLRPSVLLYGAAGFVFFFTLPVMDGSTQALFQTKVDTAVQGRFFALSTMIATAVKPLASLIAGPMADRVFEPAMAVNGRLANTFIGQLIGTGEGRGIGLLFIVIGLMTILFAVAGYAYPRIRFIESELPDALPDTILVEESPLSTQPNVASFSK